MSQVSPLLSCLHQLNNWHPNRPLGLTRIRALWYQQITECGLRNNDSLSLITRSLEIGDTRCAEEARCFVKEDPGTSVFPLCHLSVWEWVPTQTPSVIHSLTWNQAMQEGRKWGENRGSFLCCPFLAGQNFPEASSGHHWGLLAGTASLAFQHRGGRLPCLA